MSTSPAKSPRRESVIPTKEQTLSGEVVSTGSGSFAFFPAYHSVTGNLPVLSAELHSGSDSASATEFEMVTGNLPVLSKEFFTGSDKADTLHHGWVELVDPRTKRKFFWHSVTKARRDVRPLPEDDGLEGAGQGDLPLPPVTLDASFTTSNAGAGASTPASPASSVSSAPGSPGGEPDPDLPEGWVKQFDNATKRVYYYHPATRESSWVKPTNDRNRSSSVTKGKWSELKDDQGRTYYYNESTRKSQWHKPPEFLEDGASGNEWQEMKDQKTGKVYYYNSNTGKTSWHKPGRKLSRAHHAPAVSSPLARGSPRSRPSSTTEKPFFPDLPSPQPASPAGAPAPESASAPAAKPAEAPSAPTPAGAPAPVEAPAPAAAEPDVAAASSTAPAAGSGADAAAGTPAAATPERSGYLSKRGGGYSLFGKQSWKRRFVVLKGGKLSYYKTAEAYTAGAKPLKGVYLPLEHYRLGPQPDTAAQFCLVTKGTLPESSGVKHPERVFMFEAESVSEKESWVEDLVAATA